MYFSPIWVQARVRARAVLCREYLATPYQITGNTQTASIWWFNESRISYVCVWLCE